MIRGMVEGLAGRLADEGGPAEDWARLIASLGVLGETERAAAILAEARDAFAASAADLALLDDGRQARGAAAMSADAAAFAAALPPRPGDRRARPRHRTIGVAVSDAAALGRDAPRRRSGAPSSPPTPRRSSRSPTERAPRRLRPRPAAQHGRQRGPALPVDPRLRPQPVAADRPAHRLLGRAAVHRRGRARAARGRHLAPPPRRGHRPRRRRLHPAGRARPPRGTRRAQ